MWLYRQLQFQVGMKDWNDCFSRQCSGQLKSPQGNYYLICNPPETIPCCSRLIGAISGEGECGNGCWVFVLFVWHLCYTAGFLPPIRFSRIGLDFAEFKDMKVKTIEIAWHRRPEANHNDPVLSVDFLDDSIFVTGGGDHEVKVQSWWMVLKDRFGDWTQPGKKPLLNIVIR